MTRTDLDRRIAAYLEAGPEVLPDWVQYSVLEQIHVTARPAAGWRSSRFVAYAGYAAVVVLLITGAWLLGRIAGPDIGGQFITPEPLPVASGELDAGGTYQTAGFSLPIRFQLPTSSDGAEADMLDEHSLRVRPTAGGAITIHHDAALADDLCHPTGLVSNFDTADDVRSWLASSEGVTLGPERQLSLASGQSALAWDITLADDCWIGERGSVGETVWLAAGETPRIYAIPVAGDVLVGITWGAGEGSAAFDQINPTADALVQSIAVAD
jgi:hypothetical protein